MKLSTLLMVTFAIVLAGSTLADGTQYKKMENTTGTTAVALGDAAGSKFTYLTFTANDTFKLGAASFWLNKSGGSSFNNTQVIQLCIYSVSATPYGEPSSVIGCSNNSFSANNVSTWNNYNQTFNPNEVNISSGTQYALVLNFSTIGSAAMYLQRARGASTTQYSYGESSNGITWSQGNNSINFTLWNYTGDTALPATIYFSLTATDGTGGGSITTFNATINGTFYSTTNGTINTYLNQTVASIVNITVNAEQYYSNTTLNHNTSGNNATTLYRSLRINASDTSGNALTTFNATVNGNSYFTSNGTIVVNDTQNSTFNLTIYASQQYSNTTQNWLVTTNPNTTKQFSLYDSLKINATSTYNQSLITLIYALVNGVNYTSNSSGHIRVNDTTNTTFNVTTSASNFFDNATINYNVATNTNRTLQTYNYPWTMIRVKSLASGTFVDTFEVNYTNNADISENGSTSTTIGYLWLPLYQATYTTLAYNIYNGSTNFAQTTVNLTASDYLQAYNFTAYTTNSILFNFYDETNNSLINWANITAYITSDLYSTNFTTNNGSYYIDLLTPEDYKITYGATGYSTREYFYSVINQSTTTINLFLLNSTTDDIIQVEVQDTTANLVEGAVVKLEKQNLSGTNYYLTEMCTTDALGTCLLHVQLYDTTYKFLIDYPLGTTKLNTGDTKIATTSLLFIINLESNPFTEILELNSVQYNLTNTSSNIVFSWNDQYSNVQTGCLEVSYRRGSSYTLANSSCTSSASGTISLPYYLTADEWKGCGYINTSATEQVLAECTTIVTGSFKEEFGTNGLFLFGFILLGTIIFSGLYNPVVAILLGVFSLLMLTAFNFIGIGMTAAIGMLCAGGILIYLLRRT